MTQGIGMTKTTTTKSTKVIIEHVDRLGAKIEVGSQVAYPDGNHLHIGTVKKLNPKMIGISKFNDVSRTWGRATTNKYPDDCIVLEGPRVTMYLIKHAK